jgi:coproporphyrinogen dehydrogenase HemZ
MIEIILSDKTFENDVYPLVKAFYPEELIKVFEEQEYRVKAADQAETGRGYDPEVLIRITLEFKAEQIEAAIEGAFNQRVNASLPSITMKSQYKNAMKRVLYQILSEATQRTLPWGILTGIRPTKLVYELLEQGEDDVGISRKMREEYLCSEEKIGMSIDIARRELTLLQNMDYRNGYSLYIGIPFCPSTCLYCSFTSYSISKYSDYVEQYLTALEKEIHYASTCFPRKKLTTVYFGGGTPTTLAAKQLDRLLGLVREKFDFSYVKEFCVEAGRPDSITEEKLRVLKKWGVNRISINPQSMQQKTLDLIGRRHTVEQIRSAFQLARETGHDNINMDIILGLPGETREEVRDTLMQIKEMEPESLTVHTLAVKRAARLNIEKEQYVQQKASGVTGMLQDTIRFAKENAYLPYYLYRQKNMAENLENIGYSREGREGLYNILIMEEKQTILALGAGGMSKFVFHQENRLERVDNVKSITDYVNRIDEMILRKQEFLDSNGYHL